MSKKAKKAAAARRLSDKRGRRDSNQKIYQTRAAQGINTISKRQKLNAKRVRQVRTTRNKSESLYPPPKMNHPAMKFLRHTSGPLKGQIKRQLTSGEIAALEIWEGKPKKWNSASEMVGYLSRVRSGG